MTITPLGGRGMIGGGLGRGYRLPEQEACIEHDGDINAAVDARFEGTAGY